MRAAVADADGCARVVGRRIGAVRTDLSVEVSPYFAELRTRTRCGFLSSSIVITLLFLRNLARYFSSAQVAKVGSLIRSCRRRVAY